MDDFYRHLQTSSKSEACRLAQLDLIKTHPHPFYWAPFQLVGDWK
jgi:CHAT domain-containing protein